MLTPSLLLQAFQLPPSLKGSESEQKRQPDADSTTTRKRLSQTKQVYNQEGKGRSSSAWPLTPNVPMWVGVKPQRRSRKPPLLLKWQVQVGILSALLFTVSLSSSSSVHTSHNLILMGELCLQFHDQSNAYKNQDLLNSHYLVTSSTGKCLGRTESALKLRVMMTFQHCNGGFYSEGYFLFWSLCI